MEKLTLDTKFIQDELGVSIPGKTRTVKLKVPSHDFEYEFKTGEQMPSFTMIGTGIEPIERLILKAT